MLKNEDLIKIKELAQQGLSQRQIGQIIGIGKSTVGDILRGTSRYAQPVMRGLVEQGDVRQPRILIFDLEISPEISMHFGRYQVNINDDFNLKQSHLLSFSAKWLGEDEIVTLGLPYYDNYKNDPDDDSELAADLHKLLSEADIVVAHNLKGFDWKVAQTRFLLSGLELISPTKLVDTLQIARYNFKFPNNKLDTIARILGVGSKLEHSGAKLWRQCLEGNKDAWKKMLDYNTVDVEILEQVYLKLRAYDKRHPNVAMYYEDKKVRCVCCGSTDLILTDKKSFTGVSEFDVYQCQDCGKHSRSRKNNLEKGKRESLLMNIAQ